MELNKFKSVRWLLLLAILLAACAPAGPVETPTENPIPDTGAESALRNTSWQLVSFGPVDAAETVLPDPTITLEFGAEDKAGGQGGCNSYGSTYVVEGDTLKFEEIVSTLIACDDEAIATQEQEYLQALRDSSRFTLAGDTLTIWYNKDESSLNYERASAVGSDQVPERIELGTEDKSAQRTGLLPSGLAIKQYVVAAKEGQTMSIEVTSADVPVSLTITSPSGTEVFTELDQTSSPEGGYRAAYSFQLAEAGDYLVKLSKADQTPSTNYTLDLTIQ